MGAAVELGANVFQIGAVGQSILSDDVNVTAIEFLVLDRLAIVRDEAVAKNRVGGTKAPWVRAAKQDRVLGHLRIQRLSVRAFERRRKHVMAEPVAEPMAALLVVRPVGHDRMQRHQSEKHQSDA